VGYLNNYILPTVFTAALHAALLVALLVGWQWNDHARYRPETLHYVKAELVTIERPKVRQAAPREVPPPHAAPAPTPAPEPKPAPAARVAPQPEAIAIPDGKAAPAKPNDAPKPKPKPEPKPKPRPEAQPKPAAKPQAAPAPGPTAEAARKQARRDAMAEALAEEEQLQQAEQDEATAASYAAIIKGRVEATWSRPPSARKEMQVVLSIRLIPTGEVVGVEVLNSSGNLAFDRSAIIAVEKAERFPELQSLPGDVFESYFRRFTLVFKPEDLLL